MKYLLALLIPFCLCTACLDQEKTKEEEEAPEKSPTEIMWDNFIIQKEELHIDFEQESAELSLAFKNYKGQPEEWRQASQNKFRELIGFDQPGSAPVKKIRELEFEGVNLQAFIMTISDQLSIPAYVLQPEGGNPPRSAVMAIHGHGRVEPAIGAYDDYHHKMAFELAKAGHLVIAPELRGFSKLNNMAEHDSLDRLDYWEGWYQFTLATDGFLYGNTMIGETVEDLIRWENWFTKEYQVDQLDVCGISYGGDLAIYYPVFSEKVNRIFCSGSMGSFSWIFRSCYNAPAHCIPGVLDWMDRADIAGLLAPSPILIHYGELDTPGDGNASAAYNPSGKPAYEELKTIYEAFGVTDAISWLVTKGKHHEMDIPALIDYFK